jgi:hypothetical protein
MYESLCYVFITANSNLLRLLFSLLQSSPSSASFCDILQSEPCDPFKPGFNTAHFSVILLEYGSKLGFRTPHFFLSQIVPASECLSLASERLSLASERLSLASKRLSVASTRCILALLFFTPRAIATDCKAANSDTR